MNDIKILKSGFSDDISVLSENEMDEIVGGAFTCKKNFAFTDTSIECGCGYTTSWNPSTPLPGTGGGGTSGSTDTGTVSKPGTGNGH